MNVSTPSPTKRVKPCRVTATVTMVTVVVALAILVVLMLTVFRPRDPTFIVYPVGLHGLDITDLLRSRNLTRGVVIGVDNENYGSVSWRNFTVLVELHDDNNRWWHGYVSLTLTVFRPRDPTFTIYLVGLRGSTIADLLGSKNLTTGIIIGNIIHIFLYTVKFSDFATGRNAHNGGQVVGEIPIPEGIVAQRSTVNVTTNATIQLDKLEGDLEDVLLDLQHGGLDFTCSVTAFAYIRPFNVLPRIRGSISVECFGSVYINRTPVPVIGFIDGQAWCWTVKKRVVI
ncbi:hypothetical protein LINGRAHAP2_LOCUS18856 [Linum grandiflorum]